MVYSFDNIPVGERHNSQIGRGTEPSHRDRHGMPSLLLVVLSPTARKGSRSDTSSGC